MLIHFFRKSYLFQYILLLVISIVLWIGAIIHPVDIPVNSESYLTPAYSLLQGILNGNLILLAIIAMILVISGALLFNYSLTKFDLVPKNTLVPAMVYIVLMSYSPNLLGLHPVAFPALFTILILFYLFQVYTEEEAYAQVYNIGLLIGISSLFYFPSIFLILFIWLTFVVYRLYSWREWVIPITGIITPYIFLFTYYFMVNNLEPAYLAYVDYFTKMTIFHFSFDFSILNYIITALIILLSLWSAFLLLADIQEKIISLRKRYWAIFYLLAIAILTYFISDVFFMWHQVFILIPASVFIAYTFSQLKNLKWIEIIWGILFILIVINNLLVIF